MLKRIRATVNGLRNQLPLNSTTEPPRCFHLKEKFTGPNPEQITCADSPQKQFHHARGIVLPNVLRRRWALSGKLGGYAKSKPQNGNRTS